jgi:thimet oligopeptidase
MTMRFKIISIILLLVVVAVAGNPFFPGYTQRFDFSLVDSTAINNARNEVISEAKADFAKIYAVPKEKRTWENSLLAIDDILSKVNIVYAISDLLANTHPDKGVRDASNAGLSVFGKYLNEVNMDLELYRSVKEYAQLPEAKSLTGYQAKYLKETIRDFERNGLGLAQEKRKKLKEIQDKISDLAIEFSKNIAEYQDSLIVGEDEIKGLPDDYKQARKRPDGTYKIDLSYPSVFPFFRYAESEQARETLYKKFLNMASNKNLEILKEALILRQEMAQMLGYKTFAAYRVETRMAQTPQNVWTFEEQLIKNLEKKAGADYEELLAIKRASTGDPDVKVINAWEKSYYNNLLLMEKYQLDRELLKEYFEVDKVIDGFFQISQQLFDVTFKEVEQPSVWHEQVRLIEVFKDKQLVGRFYLDLYPRENKFNHAAMFQMVGGKLTDEGYRIPTASLVCNFPKATADKPALLLHSDVQTFFHEFGHLLHFVLTRAELDNFSGTNVARDFVEAPSQFLENWTWNYQALSLFAKHYKTGEVLPKQLHDKMIAAKNVGSGLDTQQQVFYGLIDFTLHDRYNPQGTETTSDIVRKLQNTITLFPYVEGTHLEAGFGHLMGYEAGYYSYLWAEVYAQDLFSVFEQNGILDKETGRRFRDIILARGSSQEELSLVKEFLGRNPNQEAFLKSLGLN